MEFISEYVALVQFVGAFNFVFSTKLFHEHLSEHFVNVSKKQKSDFEAIKNKIKTDITTLNSRSPLNHDGQSNEHELIAIKNKYTTELSKIESTDKNLSTAISEQKQPNFSRQFFLLIGLYSLFSIFCICKIGHLHAQGIDSTPWHNALCLLDLATLFCWLYFLVCEIVWFFIKSDKSNPPLLSPSFSWCACIYLIMMCAVLLCRAYLPEFDVQDKIKVYVTLCIPLLAFISSILLFLVANVCPWIKTTWHRKRYNRKLKELTKEKDDVLSPYMHLKASEFKIS